MVSLGAGEKMGWLRAYVLSGKNVDNVVHEHVQAGPGGTRLGEGEGVEQRMDQTGTGDAR